MSGARATYADDEDDIQTGAGDVEQDGAQQAQDADDSFPFDIIDVDDKGKPLGREASGSEDDNDEGTLLDQRRREERSGQDYADERRAMSPEQRSRSRKSARERQREARDRNIAENGHLRQQLDEMRNLLQGVMPRLDAHDRARTADALNSFQSGIETQDAIATSAKNRWVQAMQDGDHQAAIEAQEMREAALVEKARLSSEKKQLEDRLKASDAAGDGRGAPSAPRNSASPNNGGGSRLSPQAENRMNDFFAKHPWINRTNAQDPESAEVRALDNLVAARGFKPDTADYWNALEDAMRDSPVVGHRFDDDDDRRPAPRPTNGRGQQPAPARRGPQVGDPTNRGTQQGGRQKFFLSPGRKQALLDMNIIANDGSVVDAKRLERMIGQYRAYDAQHASG